MALSVRLKHYNLAILDLNLTRIVFLVDRARRKADPSKVVALKEVRMEKEKDGLPITTVREIKLLSRLNDHPHLVRLEEVAVGQVSNQFFLVFEYANHDLTDVIEHPHSNIGGSPFQLGQIKQLLLQLLEAVDYLHSHWIIHRDIKVSNLLYFDDLGILKLADLGLARTFSHFQGEPHTPETVTLWYRAPEILFASFCYGPPADMWSVGCVFAELLLGKPLFPGATQVEQINLIGELLGPPLPQEWPGHTSLEEYKPPDVHASSIKWKAGTYAPRFHSLFRNLLDESGLDLLQKLFRYDPAQRITAAEALQHPFFANDPQPTPIADMPSFHYILRKPPKDQGNTH